MFLQATLQLLPPPSSPPPPSLFFDCGGEDSRARLISLLRDTEFDSHLIVPRLIRDPGFHYLGTTKLHRDDSSLRPTLSGERRLSTSKGYVHNNCSQNIRVAATEDENKIATPSGRQPSMKVETWLVRVVGWTASFDSACRTRRKNVREMRVARYLASYSCSFFHSP